MSTEQETWLIKGEPGNWVINEEEILRMMDEAERNSKFIQAHYQELLQQYPDSWIAVYQEEVVASSKSNKALVKKMDALGCLRKGSVTRYMDTDPPMWMI